MGKIKYGERYYRDIDSWGGKIERIRGIDGIIYIKQSFPYRIERNKKSELYYGEIYVDLERQYIAEGVIRDILDNTTERRIKYNEVELDIDEELKNDIKTKGIRSFR